MRHSLPLGLDLGSTRIRLAALHNNREGLALTAVASREIGAGFIAPRTIAEPDLVCAIIEDLRHEIGQRQRYCVLSLRPEAASMRFVRFPSMRQSERVQAARFQAGRAKTSLADGTDVVRVHPVHPAEGVYAVGIARRDTVDTFAKCVKRSGLRTLAIDFDAMALRRAFPGCDAVIDVGNTATRLHLYGALGPVCVVVERGGLHVTRSIAADLSIDERSAEERKRRIGTAGAGDAERDVLARAIASALSKERHRITVRTVALVGNGARLPDLAAAIEQAAAVTVMRSRSRFLCGSAYPEDVMDAASADWTLAVSLAAWSA